MGVARLKQVIELLPMDAATLLGVWQQFNIIAIAMQHLSVVSVCARNPQQLDIAMVWL